MLSLNEKSPPTVQTRNHTAQCHRERLNTLLIVKYSKTTAQMEDLRRGDCSLCRFSQKGIYF